VGGTVGRGDKGESNEDKIRSAGAERLKMRAGEGSLKVTK